MRTPEEIAALPLFKDDEKPNPEPADVSGGTKGTARFRMTSAAFSDECRKNRNGFAKKYTKKPVELTGIVVGVGSNLGSVGNFLVLDGVEDPDRFTTIEINCQFDGKAPWKQARPGQTVRLQGTVDMVVDPVLQKCRILAVGGEAWKTREAEELAIGFAASDEKATAKFKGRFVPVTGEIAKIEFNDVKACGVTLKGPDGVPPVKAIFTAFEEKSTSGLKVGQKIAFFGRSPTTLGEYVEIYQCQLDEE